METGKNKKEPEILVIKYKNLKLILIYLLILLAGIFLWYLGISLRHHDNGSPVTQPWQEISIEFLKDLGEFMCLVLSLHLIYDIFIKKEDRKILISELAKNFSPYIDKLDFLNKNILNLDDHAKTIFDITKYVDSEFFKVKFEHTFKSSDKIYILGDIPNYYYDYVCSELDKTNTEIYIYTSVNEFNRDCLVNLLNFEREKRTNRLHIFQIDRFDWGYVTIGTNETESISEVLINYETSFVKNLTGYYICGETANNILKSLKSRLGEQIKGWEGSISRVTKVSSEEVLDYIIERKIEYHCDIDSLNHGMPLSGPYKICDKMISTLKSTSKTMKVTHFANEASINLLTSKDLQNWIHENYHATTRGVIIERIFILPQPEMENPTLIGIMDEMKANKILVKYVFVDHIKDRLKEDFSIYDDQCVVFIWTPNNGAWLGTQTEARFSKDDFIVKKYKEIFHSLDEKAVAY